MSQITVTIKGADVIQSGLKKLGLAVTNMPAAVVRPEMDAARDELRTYPAELPGQRYVRTGARYRATRVEAGSNNQYVKSYTLKSDPTYRGRSADPYVVGDAYGRGQAGIHQGRWALIVNVVEKALDRMVEKANQMFNDVINQGGMGL